MMVRVLVIMRIVIADRCWMIAMIFRAVYIGYDGSKQSYLRHQQLLMSVNEQLTVNSLTEFQYDF